MVHHIIWYEFQPQQLIGAWGELMFSSLKEKKATNKEAKQSKLPNLAAYSQFLSFLNPGWARESCWHLNLRLPISRLCSQPVGEHEKAPVARPDSWRMACSGAEPAPGSGGAGDCCPQTYSPQSCCLDLQEVTLPWILIPGFKITCNRETSSVFSTDGKCFHLLFFC